MPPVGEQSDAIKAIINRDIEKNKVLVFSNSSCASCKKVKDLFAELTLTFAVVELDELPNGNQLLEGLREMTGLEAPPFVFVNGVNIGGCDSTLKVHSENKLLTMIHHEHHDYEYDLVVIGGGSGGLAASKEAARLGKKVAVCDFVKPSPQGTTWGVGGTCVNVGCIPKKMMHHAALVAHDMEGVENYGWNVQNGMNHDWTTMKDNIQDHIGSLNWSYRVQLREATVDYYNAFAEFTGPHTVKTTNKRGKVQDLTAQYFILAMGGRPRYPDIPGLQEYCITSDDIFSLPHSPGKTLVIGASYIALECGGFLAGVGLDVTVMVRSILLRGFDQQIAEKIGEYMSGHGVKFIRGAVPTKIERVEEGSPGKLRVTGRTNNGEEIVDEYNTVLIAAGRDPCTSGIGLEKVGVQVNSKTGFISVTHGEQTNIPYIYAIGDILEGKMELTPLAIQAGKLLAKRLFAGAKTLCDYINVPTTVFTPIEYGAIGYSEENALAKYGDANIEVYHSNFQPYEWVIPKHDASSCYVKLICLTPENERVIGFHYLGPSAGEITQGFCVAMKAGAKKEHFDMTIGIHPTSAEMITNLGITKRSGKNIEGVGCTG